MQHESLPTWKVQNYVNDLKTKKEKSWRDIYWHIWGRATILACYRSEIASQNRQQFHKSDHTYLGLTVSNFKLRCNVNFPAAEWKHCSYHSEPPIIPNGSRVGKYPCCGQPAHKQRNENNPNSGYLGCLSREHQASIGAKPSVRKKCSVPFLKIVSCIVRRN